MATREKCVYNVYILSLKTNFSDFMLISNKIPVAKN